MQSSSWRCCNCAPKATASAGMTDEAPPLPAPRPGSTTAACLPLNSPVPKVHLECSCFFPQQPLSYTPVLNWAGVDTRRRPAVLAAGWSSGGGRRLAGAPAQSAYHRATSCPNPLPSTASIWRTCTCMSMPWRSDWAPGPLTDGPSNGDCARCPENAARGSVWKGERLERRWSGGQWPPSRPPAPLLQPLSSA